MAHEMAEQVARLVVQVFSTEPLERLQTDIRSHTEELLKSRGEEDLLNGKISVEVDKSSSGEDSAEVKFTCKSKSALYACREIILPWLAHKYKTIELAPEYSLEASPDQVTDVPPSVSSSKTTSDSEAAAKIEPPTPFSSIAALMSAHTELLQSEIPSDAATGPDFLERVKEFIRRGTETGTRLNDTDERRTAQSLLNYWVTVLYRADATPPPDAILAYYSQPADLSFDSSECPYIGLSPFRETDKERFFGRQQLTTAIVQRLKEKRLAVLVGPSGSGKTSALNAGVLPILKEGKVIPESKDWNYFPAITPGSDPLAHLASLFTGEAKHNAEELLKKPEHLLQLLTESSEQPAVLIIDQFEELFTVSRDEERREAFINCLLSLRGSSVRHRVILSMRSDRINHIIRRPALNELFRDAEIRVYPAGEIELHEMIEKPAQNIGLKFQPGVVDQLIREVFQDPVGLPLMQFTLLELWDDREGDTITWAALNRLGSCRQALVTKAESVYQGLTPDEKTIARRILLRMVRLSDTWEATTEPVRREDLYLPGEDGKLVDLVLKKLLAANLARISNISYESTPPSDGGPGSAGVATELASDHQFELAHESLARNWPEVVGWLRRLREALVTRQRLELFAANWAILGRSEKGLLDKYQLHEAQNWLVSAEAKELGYNPDSVALLGKSQEAEKREQRVRKAWLIGFALLILMVLVFVVALGASEHRRLKQATSLRLAVQAGANKTSQLDLALLLSLEAYSKHDKNAEARRNLMSALTYSPKLRAYLHNGQGKLKQMAFSEDGKKLSALNFEGDATMWDAVNYASLGKPLKAPKIEDQTYKNYATWLSPREDMSLLSHDGRQLVRPGKENSLIIWDVETRQEVRTIPAITEADESFLYSYSNDNRTLAWFAPAPDNESGDDRPAGYELTLWDVAEQRKIRSTPSGEVLAIAFSPDNQMLATSNARGEIILYSIRDLKPIGKPLVDAFNPYVENRITFSRDGKRLASINQNEELTVWDIQDRKALPGLRRPDLAAAPQVKGQGISPQVGNQEMSPQAGDQGTSPARIEGFDLSNDGKELVAGFADGKVIFWNVEDKAGIELPTGRSKVSSITFSPDNKILAGASDDGTIIVWNLGKQELIATSLEAPNHGSVNAQVFSDDGKTLFSRNLSDQIVVFDVNTTKVTRSFSVREAKMSEGTQPQVGDAVFNKNGTLLAVRYSDKTVAVWDLESGKPQVLPGPPADPSNDKDSVIRSASVISIAIDSTGKRVAAGNDIGEIVVWNLDTGQPSKFTGGPSRIVSLAFNSDGTTLASATGDGDIILWDTDSMKQRFTLTQWSGEISNLAFTDDDKRLISLSEEGALNLWDVADKPEGELLAESNLNVSSCVTSPDGSGVACVGNNRSIVLWDLETRRPQFDFSSGEHSDLVSLAYAQDGRTLAAGYTDGTIRLYNVAMEMWAERACQIANRNLTWKEWGDYKVFDDQSWRRWVQFWKEDPDFYREYDRTCPNLP